MSITYVDHDSGATFVHGHVHLRQSDRCLTGTCVNIPLRDRIAAALQSGTVIDAIERIIETELRLRTDALNRTGATNDQLRAELADANARLANVERLHRPDGGSGGPGAMCVTCTPDFGKPGEDPVPWPCSTAAALSGGRDGE